MVASLTAFSLGFSWHAPIGAQDAAREPEKAVAKPEETEKSASDRTFSLDRYAGLWQRSLFHAALAHAVADAAFARDYSLAGVFEMNGVTTAALVHNRDGSVVNISDSQAATDSAGGMKLLAVEAVGDSFRARVKVEKAGQSAWIAVARTVANSNAIDGRSASMAIPPRSSAPVPVAPVPVAPTILPVQNSATSSPAAQRTQPPREIPPLPPSPLDAAMLEEENDFVVPLPE